MCDCGHGFPEFPNLNLDPCGDCWLAAEGVRTRKGNHDRPSVIVSTWRSSTMQPSSPVAFLGVFLVGLATLVGVLVSVFGQLTQLNAP